jgi:hypothetical protein
MSDENDGHFGHRDGVLSGGDMQAGEWRLEELLLFGKEVEGMDEMDWMDTMDTRAKGHVKFLVLLSPRMAPSREDFRRAFLDGPRLPRRTRRTLTKGH